MMHDEVDGADNVLRYQKWRHPRNHKLVVIGCAPSETGAEDDMAKIRRAMSEELKRDQDDPELKSGCKSLTFGPELPNISSTQVRNALEHFKGDRSVLRSLLPDSVLDWVLAKGFCRSGRPP